MSLEKRLECDLLIIGAGIAGLSAAITASNAEPGPTPLTDSYEMRTPIKQPNDNTMRSQAGGNRQRRISTCQRHAEQQRKAAVTHSGKY